jgi:hypothetical protein
VATVRKLSLAVCDVISLLTKNRKVLRMSNAWKLEHREAIMGSVPLQEKIFTFRTAVVFHLAEGSVMAEMLGASGNGIKKMSKFLHSLIPTNTTWVFPAKHLDPSPRPRFWNAVRNKYAARILHTVETKRDGSQVMHVEVFGFRGEGLLAGAYEALSQAAAGRVQSLQLPYQSSEDEATQQPPPVPPHWTGMTGGDKKAAGSDETLLKNSPTASSAGHNGTGPVIAVYKFKAKDRHASHFFSSYEKMFQRFFLRRYNVNVTCFCTTAPSSSRGNGGGGGGDDSRGKERKGKGASQEENGDGGLCMLDMRGGTAVDMHAVKHYLSHMMERLAVQQVLFEQVDAGQYQRIVQAKQLGTRAFFPPPPTPTAASAAASGRVSEGVLDPLAHGELLSLRMEPPLLHVQGSKSDREFLFPVDVVVYVCSPTASTTSGAGSGHSHSHSSKVKGLMDTLRALKHDFMLAGSGGHGDGHGEVEEGARERELEELERVRKYYYQQQQQQQDRRGDGASLLSAEPPLSGAHAEVDTYGLFGASSSLGSSAFSAPTAKRSAPFSRGHVSRQELGRAHTLTPSSSFGSLSTLGCESTLPSFFSLCASTPTSSCPSYYQSFEQCDMKEDCFGLRLPAPAVPLQEAADWRNTFDLLDLDLDLNRDLGRGGGRGGELYGERGGLEPQGRRWGAGDEEGGGEEHSLMSDDLSCFSSHSFATFMSPLTMHSAPGRSSMSSMAEEAFGGQEEGEGALARACIIEGINVLIEDRENNAGGGGGVDKRKGGMDSTCGAAGASTGSAAPAPALTPTPAPTPAPLSYTQALLTPPTRPLPTPAEAAATAAGKAPALPPPVKSSKEAVGESVYNRTVHWPHTSFRYMFLADHMKQRIQTTIKAVECKV